MLRLYLQIFYLMKSYKLFLTSCFLPTVFSKAFRARTKRPLEFNSEELSFRIQWKTLWPNRWCRHGFTAPHTFCQYISITPWENMARKLSHWFQTAFLYMFCWWFFYFIINLALNPNLNPNPFTGSHGLKICQQLLKLISSAHPHIDLRVIFRPVCRLSHFFRFKDRIPMCPRSNFVYKFTCQRCSSLYLVETARNLHIRICEHMGISPYTGNEISHPSSLSSILAHKRETGHPISFDDFSVLASGRSELDTLIRESLLIAKINPSLNVNVRSLSSHVVWIFFDFFLSP